MNLILSLDNGLNKAGQLIIPLLLTSIRLWVAWVFLRSGYLKLTSWDSTLYLFEMEYQVPLISWELAAWLGTAAELILPLFLILGLMTRLFSLLLFTFNLVAVISYPVLWEQGFYDHQLWGLMLVITFIWGAGPIAIDSYFVNKNRQTPNSKINKTAKSG